jgi:hypothetical protein
MKKSIKAEEKKKIAKIVRSSKLEELEIKKIEEKLKKKEQEEKSKKVTAASENKASAKPEEKKPEHKPEQKPWKRVGKRDEKKEEVLEEWHDGVFITAFSPTTDSSPIIKQDKRIGAGFEPLEQAMEKVQVPGKEEKKEDKVYSASKIEKEYFNDVYADVKEKYTGRDWSEERTFEHIQTRGRQMSDVSHARDGRGGSSGVGRSMGLIEDGMLSMGRAGRDEHIKYDMALRADKDEHMDGFAPEFESKYKHRKKL